ncbi:MAG: MraY family glycosyltransferase [Acidimicrobiales bacterium]
MGVVALTAGLLGSIGLLDDHRSLHARTRLCAQGAAALVVLAVGIRAQVTGVVAVDAVLTVVWIVGITNAVNFLDNMDGLAAGISAAAGSATFILAAASGQGEVARLAGALTGACLGFLVYNRRPASIFMGDAGSLFLGFILAVAVMTVDPALMPPSSFVVPLLLLALPVLDTSTVVVSRLRRGRPVGEAGKDHLSHRLVAQGLSPGVAATALVGAELILALLAVLVGRGLVPLPVVAVAAGLVVLIVLFSTASAPVYGDRVVGFPRRLRVVVLGAATVLAALSVTPAVVNVDILPTDRQAISAGGGEVDNGPSSRSPGEPQDLDQTASPVQVSLPQALAASGLVVVLLTLLPIVRRRLRAPLSHRQTILRAALHGPVTEAPAHR